MSLPHFDQSLTDPAFVQDPYPAYDRARALGDIVWWADLGMPAAMSHHAVTAVLKDRRFGREVPADQAAPCPAHLAPFYAVEAHSMLELEPPRHTRLRGLVLRAFTSARVAALAPDIQALATDLITALPDQPVDFLTAVAQPLPARVICRLLGVPEADAAQLVAWSNAMVAMYQTGRTAAAERRAVAATTDFQTYLQDIIAHKRQHPRDDLLTALVAAEGDALTPDELISNVILLLNAGHEATVHTLGNAVRLLVESPHRVLSQDDTALPGLVEEVLRFDPPLHIFTRYAYQDVKVAGTTLVKGTQIACVLGAANRDPLVWHSPAQFDPGRTMRTNASFGAGLHFCVGAPLARLELQIALQTLFRICPNLHLAKPARYADIYHFHGLERLLVSR
ncbi:cytochrome P450 [Actibacterium sp. 188UL27-1]|uniref:cytochrome P450 n=1 Tax=Actibacterium sp. 188UL27-1 TaxID=2786961 RepID=UPI00195EA044|nr:cytochrome P450 [Actibacterium sp. 188UL27-1]MBM7070257.1 cytochrome P450 [Actibacterium sp. 188UL27-1]